jgi:hypothetical protein
MYGYFFILLYLNPIYSLLWQTICKRVNIHSGMQCYLSPSCDSFLHHLHVWLLTTVSMLKPYYDTILDYWKPAPKLGNGLHWGGR